ncbi:RIP metalloprotease RseP [Campylobacter sp. CCUG 57310]|uniref:RIP metalloprotease RseP n=1 Tax=Campylobacter sp. CCUG 57310 TaxID=2517362 RepID=UPI00156517A0|nr:RIP metalloprotease RseP [Campylobacter sp. CCUG 57310]QKF92196.1 RseP-like zinc metalloprotease, M50 family [Campylobacter sp. CCUG 57310]
MKSIIFVILLLIAGVYAYSWYFFITVFAISFLVFFHELGHFTAARILKVGVLKFSVGFGESLYSKKIGQTEYAISAIPLGGYVSLKGQDDSNPAAKSMDDDSYNKLTPLGRIFILFAGPFFNFALAFLLFIALGYIGVDRLAPVVGSVVPDSAALQAGIMKNDKILSIDGVTIREWDQITKQILPKPTTIEIEREGKILTINLTPKIGESLNLFREKIQKPLIGISPSGEIINLKNTGLNSIKFAYKETLEASKLIFIGIGKLIEGVVPMKDMGGIIQIADITSKAAKIGISTLLIITALISVNLGVLNLLPIPALDGGHILFNLYELIFRREMNEKVYIGLTYCGWALLLTLMIFATFNDILRLSGSGQ